MQTQHSAVAARVRRGIKLANAGAVKRYGADTFVVRGTARNYTVHLDNPNGEACDCPDHRERGMTCKHIYAVSLSACRRAGTARPKTGQRH